MVFADQMQANVPECLPEQINDALYHENTIVLSKLLTQFLVPYQDVVERSWGMQFHAYHSTQTVAESLYDVEHNNTSAFIPRTRACIFSSSEGIIISFRGSEPLNLINLRSSGK